jgi:hypothetical protein
MSWHLTQRADKGKAQQAEQAQQSQSHPASNLPWISSVCLLLLQYSLLLTWFYSCLHKSVSVGMSLIL